MLFKVKKTKDNSKDELSLNDLKQLLNYSDILSKISKLESEVTSLKNDKFKLTRELVINKLTTPSGIKITSLNLTANPNIEKDTKIKEGVIYYNNKTKKVRIKKNNWENLIN